jgi:hypothetical protein
MIVIIVGATSRRRPFENREESGILKFKSRTGGRRMWHPASSSLRGQNLRNRDSVAKGLQPLRRISEIHAAEERKRQ